ENGATWEEYFVCINGPGVQKLIEAGWFFVDGSVRPVGATSDFAQQWRELIRTIRRAQPGDADRASLMAERLLLELHHATCHAPTSPPAPALQAILDHCREHLARDVNFHALARDHAMSYSLLRQQVRKAT